MLCYFLYPQIKVFNSVIMDLINKNSLRPVHKTSEMVRVRRWVMRWAGLGISYPWGTEIQLMLLEKLQ